MSTVAYFARELLALVRTFVPHPDNNTPEKIVLWTVLSVWVVIELGTTFTAATPPVSMEWIRYIVLFVAGRQAGIESGILRANNEGGRGES